MSAFGVPDTLRYSKPRSVNRLLTESTTLRQVRDLGPTFLWFFIASTAQMIGIRQELQHIRLIHKVAQTLQGTTDTSKLDI